MNTPDSATTAHSLAALLEAGLIAQPQRDAALAHPDVVASSVSFSTPSNAHAWMLASGLLAHRDAFGALLAVGLIDRRQHDAALAHPGAAHVDPIPSLAHALAWMRLQGLISEAQQEQAIDRVIAGQFADDKATVELGFDVFDIGYDASGMAVHGAHGINHEAVNELHALGLIDDEARDIALAETPVTSSVPTHVAATLAWMASEENMLDEEQRAVICSPTAPSPMDPDAARAVTAARRLYKPMEEARLARIEAGVREVKRNRRAQILWILGLIAIFVAIVGWLSRRAS